MRTRPAVVVVLSGALALSGPSYAADPWDLSVPDDDAYNASPTHLEHGSEQIHDFEALGGVADEDWSFWVVEPRTSHELILDDLTGEAVAISLQRRDDTGTTVLQAPMPGSFVSMTWQEDPMIGSSVVYYFRVTRALACTTCTAAARYRMRLLDTTYSFPRFNNSASQVTILVIHSEAPGFGVTGTLYFRDAAGNLIGAEPFTIAGNGTAVLNTATLQGGAFAGQSGSISVANTARYGRLTGKAVALEPATGFTFDTAMSPRP